MSGMVEVPAEAPRDCPLCPRLVAFREAQPASRALLVQRRRSLIRAGQRAPADRRAWPPACKGANRTGRPFTGDFAGDLLYATLLEFGFARGQLRRGARRHAHARRLHDHQRRALRAAGEQADAGRDRHLPAVPGQPHRRLAAPCRHPGARAHRPRQHACGAGRAQIRSSHSRMAHATTCARASSSSTASIARATTPTPAS